MLNLIALATLATATEGVPFIHVGDHSVTAKNLKPFTNYFKLHLVAPDGTVTEKGDWSDRLEEVSIDGKKVWKRTQVATPPKGSPQTFVNVFDESTASPISSEFSTKRGVFYRRQFKGATIERESLLLEKMPAVWPTVVPRGQADHMETKLQEPVFDFAGGMFGILLSCFPLKEGYKVTFPFIAQFGETYQTATTEVQGREKIRTPAGVFDCYKVYTEQPAGHLTCWLANKAPYLIKVDAFGANYGDTIFEMADPK